MHVDHAVWSQYSIGLRTYQAFVTFGMNVSDQMLTSECGVLISSTSYSGFDLSLVQLIA